MYYFAYGSNMSFDQMRRLCGWHFTVYGVACLPDYEFGLDLRGYNAIRQKAGSKVYGVLYLADQKCVDILDEYEGHPNVFNRIEVEVLDKTNNKFKAWVYLEKPEEFGGIMANEEHFKRIIAGAIANRLPKEWIEFLQSFQKTQT